MIEMYKTHKCAAAGSDFGSYQDYVEITDLPPFMRDWRRNQNPAGKMSICLHRCLEAEIRALWRKGVVTTGCCCGHGVKDGYIGVSDSSIETMRALGYRQFTDTKRTFYPKFDNAAFKQPIDPFALEALASAMQKFAPDLMGYLVDRWRAAEIERDKALEDFMQHMRRPPAPDPKDFGGGQIEQNAPDQTTAHPEAYCHECGGPNYCWFAPNELWNRVMGSPEGIVCINCFVAQAVVQGIDPVWKLDIEGQP